ncbi:LacI family transcriptional regulator [Prevotella sp. AM34-19LB]|uniref:substrate-binding domain-containing protein n=1 Tax=Prevotella sp. AM34-19LB TaxID=2292364 RepID=UPI000E5CB34F|nr:substrate-binding domain-containing protein [Prevotella sp. AM34-19LB]RHC74535.1 LacI family transcriptional regulator [Prevotella sp. AM34-19LB]
MMEQLRVDGILMSACDKEHNVDLYNKVIERGIPIVFFDRTVEKVKASQVHMDDYIMSFFMVEALLRKGYKHIIHIPGPAYIRNSYERLRGYRDALEKFHIEYQAQDVLSPALSAEEGSWVMERFLEKNVPLMRSLALRRLLCWEPRVLSRSVACVFRRMWRFAACRAQPWLPWFILS